jgi:hypothetical protein
MENILRRRDRKYFQEMVDRIKQILLKLLFVWKFCKTQYKSQKVPERNKKK